MTKKPPNRRASKAERDFAAELVHRYRERDPYRIEIDGRIVERFVDGDELAKALDAFAERGRFTPPTSLPKAERETLRREGYRRLRERGLGQLEALAVLVEAHGEGDQTVRDLVYGRKKRTTQRRDGS